ncbi:catalase/peroxidase HPI, partial [Mycobacterium kansasii]
ADAYAKAWYKLIHRDLGPLSRYLGPLVPKETLPWQDVIPASETNVGADDIAELKKQVLASGLTVPQLVSTTWKAAASYRNSD